MPCGTDERAPARESSARGPAVQHARAARCGRHHRSSHSIESPYETPTLFRGVPDDSNRVVCPGLRPVEIPRCAQRDGGRRLLRPQGRRPVPLARGSATAPRRRPGSRPRTRSPSGTSRRFRSGRRIHERLTKLWNYERYSAAVEGRRLVHLRQERRPAEPGGHLQDELARRRARRSAARPEHAVVGRHRRARQHRTSPTMASTWRTRCRPADRTGSSGTCATSPPAKDLPDVIKWSKFSGAAWLKDGSGFLLQPLRRAEGRRGAHGRQQVPEGLLPRARHAAGRGHAGLRADDQPDWGFGADVTEDGRFLLIYQSEGTEPENRIFVKDLATPAARSSRSSTSSTPSTTSSATTATDVLRHDRQGAPRRRVVAIDLEAADPRTGRRHPGGPGATCSRRRDGRRPLRRSYLEDRRARVAEGLRARRPFEREVDAAGLGSIGGLQRQARTTEGSTPSPRSRTRRDLSLRLRRPARAPSSGSRKSPSTPTSTRPNRSSTRRRTARRSRCSSPTGRA